MCIRDRYYIIYIFPIIDVTCTSMYVCRCNNTQCIPLFFVSFDFPWVCGVCSTICNHYIQLQIFQSSSSSSLSTTENRTVLNSSSHPCLVSKVIAVLWCLFHSCGGFDFIVLVLLLLFVLVLRVLGLVFGSFWTRSIFSGPFPRPQSLSWRPS